MDCWLFPQVIKNNNNDELIYLPVLRIHAACMKPSYPVFTFNGGPGLSNIMPDGFPEFLLKNHDIVMIGYRGVDGSSLLTAPEIKTLFKTIDDPLSHEGMLASGQAIDDMVMRLKNQGVDVRDYTVYDVVEDMETARKALGYGEINLSGGSYGGAVAYAYNVQYEKNVNRSILAEPAFPFDIGLAEASGVDEKFQHLNELWKQSSSVEKSPDIVQTIQKVMSTLPQEYHGFVISPGRIKLMTFLGTYQQETINQVFDAFVAAENGDYSGLAYMSVFWTQVVDWFNWGEMITKIYSTKTVDRNFEIELDPPGSIIGSPLSKLGWGVLQHTHWPEIIIPERHKTPQKLDTEILLIYGSKEATPTKFLDNLQNRHLVALQDKGHMEVYSANP